MEADLHGRNRPCRCGKSLVPKPLRSTGNRFGLDVPYCGAPSFPGCAEAPIQRLGARLCRSDAGLLSTSCCVNPHRPMNAPVVLEIGRASCRESECQYVLISVVDGSVKKKNK